MQLRKILQKKCTRDDVTITDFLQRKYIASFGNWHCNTKVSVVGQ
jgi:hypothetical protein